MYGFCFYSAFNRNKVFCPRLFPQRQIHGAVGVRCWKLRSREFARDFYLHVRNNNRTSPHGTAILFKRFSRSVYARRHDYYTRITPQKRAYNIPETWLKRPIGKMGKVGRARRTMTWFCVKLAKTAAVVIDQPLTVINTAFIA